MLRTRRFLTMPAKLGAHCNLSAMRKKCVLQVITSRKSGNSSAMRSRIIRDHSFSLLACGLLACSSVASENTSFAEQDLASADGSVSATLTLQSQWTGGYCANV